MFLYCVTLFLYDVSCVCGRGAKLRGFLMRGAWIEFLMERLANGDSCGESLLLFTKEFKMACPASVVSWCIAHLD